MKEVILSWLDIHETRLMGWAIFVGVVWLVMEWVS